MKTLKEYILESKYSSIKKLSDLDLAEGFKTKDYDEALNYLKSFVKTNKQLFVENLHKMFEHLQDIIVRGHFWTSVNNRETTFNHIVSYLMKGKNIKGKKDTIEFLIPISLLMNFNVAIGLTTDNHPVKSIKRFNELQPYFEDVINDLLGNGNFDDFKKYFNSKY